MCPEISGGMPTQVTFREALRVWIRVALLSFGGPAGQIAVMHRILVEEKKWISEERFLHGLNYCMLLPGPEAQQLATYVGWLLHRTAGGLAAGLLFVLPGFLSILALSFVYVGLQGFAIVDGLFFGLKPAVMAIVLGALFKIGKRAIRSRSMLAVAAGAFLGIFFFEVPFPLIVLLAAAVGFVLAGVFGVSAGTAEPGGAAHEELLPDAAVPGLRTIRTVLIWLVLWWTPIVVLHVALGGGHVFSKLSIFFSKAAVVTFGGAYAVLAYMAEEAVNTYGWLRPGEMLDGLGMAETTPGPLLQVVQFVGFMAAYRSPGGLPPFVSASLGAVLVTWVTFAPCFLWILAGAPYVERLRRLPALSHALQGITAAVVGVILNLALWFGLHSLFGSVSELHVFGVRLYAPQWTTVSWPALLLFVGASIAMLRFRLGMLGVLAGCAVLGIAYRVGLGFLA